MDTKFDFEQFSKDLVASVKSGKPLTGVDGVFLPLLFDRNYLLCIPDFAFQLIEPLFD